MGLPLIYAQPSTAEDWSAWSFNHAANHNDWISAVQLQKNQNLTQYLLDPVDPNDLGVWLYQHQVAHNQINAVLGTSGFDLLSLDWQDKDAFAEWCLLNGSEHQRISAALGIG